MPSTIDQAFIKQFEREVHEAYQRQGSKLRKTVRQTNNVAGASTVFQKVGKGTAATKTRNGTVPVMNVSHATVECFLQDFYAGEWHDKLDQLKINFDERTVLANAGSNALGRKTDDLIRDALSTTSNVIAAGAAGLTKAKVLRAMETLADADVPDDGERYGLVGSRQWSELLGIDEFANADYVGSDQLPWKGLSAKVWLGTMWMSFPGLKKVGANREAYIYHKSAIGHASGAEVQTDITWHGDRAAHFINSMMSQGSCLIDETGAIKFLCEEAA